MRNVTQDEMDKFRKKLWEEMMDADITKLSYFTSANVRQIAQTYYQPYRGISPTDVDAKGMYGYQEPEIDEQGTFYGYKILHRRDRDCNCEECRTLISPRFPARWVDGKLRSDVEPSERSMSGIHCTKKMNHPELRQYCGRFHGAAFGAVLVRCALSGTVVETEQGFRAEFAQIVGVYQDGNWTSYQDYQERAKANSLRITKITYEDWQRQVGNWKAYTNLDPDSLP